MAEQSNTPQLKFQGYTDAWGQVKLGEILQEFSEKSVIENQYPLLSSTNTGIEYRDGRVSGEHNVGYKIIDQGDLVFSPQNLWLGNININHLGRGIVSPSYKTMKIVNYEAGFLEPILRSEHMLNQYKLASIQGASVVRRNLDPALFDEIEVPYPGLEEQRKVAAIFEQMESAVALHRRKREKLQEIKKSLLQKMFPAEGEDRPQIRFAGYTDAWGQVKLGDIAQITMGQSPDGATYTDNPKDHILVQGNADMKDHRVCPRVWTTQVTKTAEPGDIILSVRAPVGEVEKTDYDVVLGRGVSGIRGNDFIYHSLIRMNEIGYWSSLSTGSTFDSINSNDISNAVIAVPSQSEQEKIGCFLTRIDDLLSLHQRSSCLENNILGGNKT